MDDCRQNNELRQPELLLPEGLTEDTLADLMTAVLLHQAFCQTDPWAQWLIVATVEIIHGRPVPKLDQEMLTLLQDIAITENPERNPNSSHTYDQVLDESLSPPCFDKEQNSGMEVMGSKSVVDANKEMQFKYSKGQSGINLMEKNESDDKLTEMTPSDCLEGARNLLISDRKSRLDSLTTGIDFGVQTTPKILGITCNKWVQVKKIKKIVQSSQTEELLCNDKESQTECTGHFKRLFESNCDKETQTMIIEKEKSTSEKETQTLIKKEKSVHDKGTQTLILTNKNLQSHSRRIKSSLNYKWQLVPVSDLPKPRKHHSKANFNDKKKKDILQKKKPVLPCGSLTLHSSQKPLMNKYEKSVDNEEMINNSSDMDISSNDSDNSEISIPMFHGRPLIGSKSKIPAALIPMNPVSELPIIMLEDPRCT